MPRHRPLFQRPPRLSLPAKIAVRVQKFPRRNNIFPGYQYYCAVNYPAFAGSLHWQGCAESSYQIRRHPPVQPQILPSHVRCGGQPFPTACLAKVSPRYTTRQNRAVPAADARTRYLREPMSSDAQAGDRRRLEANRLPGQDGTFIASLPIDPARPRVTALGVISPRLSAEAS